MSRTDPSRWRPNATHCAPTVLVALTVLVAGLTTGVSPVVAADAARQQPTTIDSCTTITEPGEYELGGDIRNSSETVCIEIRASDVTLDGNGHRIDGQFDARQFFGTVLAASNATDETVTETEAVTDDPIRTPTTGTEVQTTPDDESQTTTATSARLNETVPMGVYVNGNGTVAREDVTVRNLRVTDWAYGVTYDNAASGTVRSVNASANYVGVVALNSTDIEVTNVTAVDSVVGVHFTDVSDSEIASAVVRGGVSAITVHRSTGNAITNATISGPLHLGVGLIDSDDNRLSGSSISDVRGALSFGVMNATAIGIDNSSDFSVEDTVATDNENWTFVAENGSFDARAENLTVDGLSVSFTGRDFGLDTTAADPLGRSTNGTTTGLKVVKTSESANVNVELNWTANATDGTTTAVASG